jgi:PAS domain S-box-containing protein
MSRKLQNAVSPAVCVAGCTLLVLTQRTLPESISGILTSLIYFGMILVASLAQGWKAGISTNALGIVCALFFFAPSYLHRSASDPVEFVRLASFGILGLVLTVICELLRRAWRRIDFRQRELDRHRRMFETALSNTPDFVFLFDVHGRFTYANKALLMLWGMSISNVIGKRFSELNYTPEIASLLEHQIQEAVRTRQPIRHEAPYISAVGTRYYEHIFVPVLGSDNEVEAIAGSARDITERKESETILREAARKKDDFLALLAHELRNPLAPIRNGLQVLRLSDERDIREQSQAMMDRQLTHLVRLVDDLLDVSRINRDKMELRRTRIPLVDVVNSAIETSRPAISEGGHELIVELPEEAILLNADLTRLAQVFNNLLTNSAKYTLQPGTIRVMANRSENEVLVTVKDEGIGIPPDSLMHIFDMFSQVDRAIDRTTGGLGIGLALVRALVEMHGGTVTAKSQGENHGSEFTVRLPVVAEMTNPLAGPTPSTEWERTSRQRVLVVDDNHDSADSMTMMLKLLGHEVALAYDGIEAVERAETFHPEIILMDVGMPKLNGLDAARRIREQSWGREITIIALTGWGQDSDRGQSKDAGCNGHLVKPVSLTDLESTLRHFVKKESDSGTPI